MLAGRRWRRRRRSPTLRLCIMPTTCGFPNCKFRSRYRGGDDHRHFYRVPKKPFALRLRWLQAIGRTEQTIINQVRRWRPLPRPRPPTRGRLPPRDRGFPLRQQRTVVGQLRKLRRSFSLVVATPVGRFNSQ